MKNIISISAAFMAATLAFMVMFTGCKKEGVSYPSHLDGIWAYSNASTGYTGVLVIEDIDGGQYAFFSLITPRQTQENVSFGSFIYDASTGEGYISSALVGGKTSITAYPSTDSKVDVTVSSLTAGKSTDSFQGTFEKKSIIDIPTGKWAGTATAEEIEYKLEMEIISIEPKSGSCGTLAAKNGTETKTATITEITSFVKMEEDTALGIMVMRDDEYLEEMPFAVVYDPTEKDVTLTDIITGDNTIELKAVNVN